MSCPINVLTKMVLGLMPCLMALPISIIEITERERKELQRGVEMSSSKSRSPNNSASVRPA